MTETLPITVVWPDTIAGIAVDTENGAVGLLTLTSGEDMLNVAFTPKQARMLAALWLNLSDELDKMG